MLTYFIDNPGRVICQKELVNGLWQDAVIDVDGMNFKVQVSRLRYIIEPDPKNPVYIQTVRGMGYKFIPPFGTESIRKFKNVV